MMDLFWELTEKLVQRELWAHSMMGNEDKRVLAMEGDRISIDMVILCISYGGGTTLKTR